MLERNCQQGQRIGRQNSKARLIEPVVAADAEVIGAAAHQDRPDTVQHLLDHRVVGRCPAGPEPVCRTSPPSPSGRSLLRSAPSFAIMRGTASSPKLAWLSSVSDLVSSRHPEWD